MQISKNISNALLLANFYCTILVVAIHYNSLYHFSKPDPTNFYFLLQSYINISLTRIAVPFFALTSGLFLFLKFEATLTNYKTSIQRRIKSLLIPYLTVATLVFAFQTFLTLSKDPDFTFGIEDFLNAIITPQTIQLWYIRDLLFLVIASPAIYFCCKKTPWLYSIPVLSMWIIDFQPFPKLGDWHLITIEALFFFTVGCLISFKLEKIALWISSSTNQTLTKFLAVYLVFTTLRVYFELNYFNDRQAWQYIMGGILHKSSILIGICALIIFCIHHESKSLLRLAGYTFFVYLYHLLPLSKFILLFWNNFITEEQLFFVTTPSALVISFYTAHLLKNKLPRIYMFLTGGR